MFSILLSLSAPSFFRYGATLNLSEFVGSSDSRLFQIPSTFLNSDSHHVGIVAARGFTGKTERQDWAAHANIGKHVGPLYRMIFPPFLHFDIGRSMLNVRC